MKKQKATQHVPTYKALPGANQIVCSCGWESPQIDKDNFAIGRKQRTPDSYFEEHKAMMGVAENAMRDLAGEQAVAPAQHSSPKKS